MKGTNLGPTGAQAGRGLTPEGTAERSGATMFCVKTVVVVTQLYPVVSPNSLN